MKCVDVKEHLETFLDGETSFARRNEVELHLEFCESCQQELAELRSVSLLLKKDLPVSPSIQLDEKVLAAFRQHQQIKKEARWNWSAIFAGIMIPKPALAIILLGLFVLTGLAFLIGRMTAPKQETVVSTIKESTPSTPTEVVKYIEVPTTKYLLSPVEKEKIITRIIYRNIESPLPETPTTPLKTNVSNDGEDTSQQVDLKDFQPIGELSPRILKKGEMNEK